MEDEIETMYEEIPGAIEEDLDPHSRKFKPGGQLMTYARPLYLTSVHDECVLVLAVLRMSRTLKATC